MQKIRLNADVEMDLPRLLESRLLIQANSGGGKSWAIRRILEQSHGKVQQIIIDPEGEFSTLREKHDYILCGKGGDVPADPRSAALLAHKLLELNVSAIIDLYELSPSDRKKFVRIFFEAVVNAPKELWHDCIFVLDEAHVCAPEKGESEAMGAVIDLATRGRKRGYCLIPATQRISKLNKDVAAECNNKLIGRCVQDIDRKRSAEELGFTSKEEILSLRNLQPGEFYVFGPAITNEVTKMKIGEVKTSHPKVGSRSLTVTVPPTEKIKKLLSKLADLPKEAEKKLQTEKEFKNEIQRLKSELTIATRSQKIDTSAIEVAVKMAIAENDREWKIKTDSLNKRIGLCGRAIKDICKIVSPLAEQSLAITTTPIKIEPKMPWLGEIVPNNYSRSTPIFGEDGIKVTGGALRMLKVLVSRYPTKLSRAQLATFARLKSSSGTYGTYLSTLRSTGFISCDGELFQATQEGIDYCGDTPNTPSSPEEVIEMWRNNISGGAKRMFDALIEIYPQAMSKEELGSVTGLESSSGTFGTYLSILSSNNLIKRNSDGISINSEIYEI